MPTVTAVTLDTLLQRGVGVSDPGHPQKQQQQQKLSLQPRRVGEAGGEGASGNGSRRVAYYFSPALYATPEPAQLTSSSPTCVSPSPYVVNHKRRDWLVAAAAAAPAEQVNDFSGVGGGCTGGGDVNVEKKEEYEMCVANGACERNGGSDGCSARTENADPVDDEIDDFFNPREQASVMSCSDMEDGGDAGVNGQSTTIGTPMLNQSEFYDAAEDFLSDGSISHSSLRTNIQSDLSSLRVSLLREIERRKKAEESLVNMQKQWARMESYFNQVGLTFPSVPDGQSWHDEDDSIAQFCQEIVVTRFVSEAFERGLARAEVEESAELVIDSNNHEISRLHDRLQYYESMNREMSQRNQEAVGLARQQRRKRRRRQRWIWGCVGLSVTVGISLLAYSYLPQASESLPSPSDLCSDSSPDTI